MAKRLEDTAFSFYELLVEASFQENKRLKLQEADMTLVKLKLYLRMSHDRKLTGIRQYEHASRMLIEIGKLLGGWIKKSEADGAGSRHAA